jgi:hypothetical protein
MGHLQQLGLGRREIVSEDRDKFMIHTVHPRVTRLTTQPDAQGFIRSDGRTLLFRNPSATIKMAMPDSLRSKGKKSKKGLEFSWGMLEEEDIKTPFAVVRDAAGAPGT